jgi:hypothetical protein
MTPDTFFFPVRTMHFQFTVRHLIGLTAAVAAVTAIAVRLNLDYVTEFTVGSYCIALIVWASLRGPGRYARWAELRDRRRRILAQRRKLKEELLQQKPRS